MILKQYFSDFLYKSICCWYSFELPPLVEAVQMSTSNMCLYKGVDKSTLDAGFALGFLFPSPPFSPI